MARLDVFILGVGERRRYVLDAQTDLLDVSGTRVVIPLVANGAIERVRDLNPLIMVLEETMILATQGIAAVPARLLKQRVTNVAAAHDDVVRALDRLFLGF